MAKSYVKFEVSKEVSDKVLEAVRIASQKHGIRKGVNEATKSVERGLSSLVVLAEDVEPEEVIMHIPMLCDQKKAHYVYVPTKVALGAAAGLKVPCAAIAIEKTPEAEPLIKDIVSKISGKSAAAAKTEAPKAEAPSAEKKEKHAAKPKAEEAK
ncbi:MAG: 50S ribosomal protein L7Ae [Candidatus Micrarchaeota archaeon]|nr:50S ribosomal protein L7Ae [Candidatus Micrarchaeota archaeon]